MKYNYKIYNKQTQEVYLEGTTSGLGNRNEQCRNIQNLLPRVLRENNIGLFSKERDNVKIQMKSIGFDDGRNIR